MEWVFGLGQMRRESCCSSRLAFAEIHESNQVLAFSFTLNETSQTRLICLGSQRQGSTSATKPWQAKAFFTLFPSTDKIRPWTFHSAVQACERMLCLQAHEDATPAGWNRVTMLVFACWSANSIMIKIIKCSVNKRRHDKLVACSLRVYFSSWRRVTHFALVRILDILRDEAKPGIWRAP